jgi:WD40 repeat protein
MTTAADIETALRAKLPAELHGDIPALAQYLADLIAKPVSSVETSSADQQPALADALQRLQGKSIELGAQTMIVVGDASAGTIDKRQGAFFEQSTVEHSVIIGELRIEIHSSLKEKQVQSTPFMVSALPDHFVPRPHEFEAIVEYLCDPQLGPVALTGLRGAGGFGKTTLAQAACHDPRVRAMFPDGVLWAMIGEHPSPADLVVRIADLVELLSGARPGFATLEAATEALSVALGDKRLLLVIDDVWDRVHLRPFLEGGPHCARLVTTRIRDILPEAARSVDVDAMHSDEALALLRAGLPETITHQDTLRALAAKLGEWPVLLRLVNGALREQVARGRTLAAALQYVMTGITKRGVDVFDIRTSTARDAAVARTIDVSLSLLRDDEAARFGELAIFPEDATIPLATLERYWGATGHLDPFDVERLCETLFNLSLLVAFDGTSQTVRLHDVVRAYLMYRHAAEVQHLHAVLLDAHRPPSGIWADLSEDEQYAWDTLAMHLREAGLGDELIATVTDPRYVIAKCWLRTALALESDVGVAQQVAPDDPVLEPLARAIQQSSHLLNACADRATLVATLYSRLCWRDELMRFSEALSQLVPRPALRPSSPLPDLPEPALRRVLAGHTSWVYGCALSADGRTVVSASFDKTVCIWDAERGTLRAILHGHTDQVNDCALSADGRTVVSASNDTTVRIWDAERGTLRATLVGYTSWVRGCALSVDGRTVVSASSDKTVRIWDAERGTLRATLLGHTDQVNGCALSADGRTVVSASSDKTVRIWDAECGTLRAILHGHTDQVNDCALSADGRTVVSASSDKTVRIWDAERGTLRAILHGHTDQVNGCALSADGRTVVSASSDKTVRIWDAERGTLRAILHGPSTVFGCALSTDGRTVVSASDDKTVRIWDAERGTLRATRQGHTSWVNGCALSADGRTVVSASSDKTVRIWDAERGTLRAILHGHTDQVNDCAMSADGRTVVSASSDKTVRIWDAERGTLRATLVGHTSWVRGCALSADGRTVVSASSDKTVRIWDAERGTLRAILHGHTEQVIDCALSADGRTVVSASFDGTVRIWDAERGTLRAILHGHTGLLSGCALSADGRTAVSVSWDRIVRIWDAERGTLRAILKGHTSPVNDCALSADGRTVVSASFDGTIRIWDAERGTILTMLHGDSGLRVCACSTDAQWIAAASDADLYFLRLVR